MLCPNLDTVAAWASFHQMPAVGASLPVLFEPGLLKLACFKELLLAADFSWAFPTLSAWAAFLFFKKLFSFSPDCFQKRQIPKWYVVATEQRRAWGLFYLAWQQPPCQSLQCPKALRPVLKPVSSYLPNFSDPGMILGNVHLCIFNKQFKVIDLSFIAFYHFSYVYAFLPVHIGVEARGSLRMTCRSWLPPSSM